MMKTQFHFAPTQPLRAHFHMGLDNSSHQQEKQFPIFSWVSTCSCVHRDLIARTSQTYRLKLEKQVEFYRRLLQFRTIKNYGLVRKCHLILCRQVPKSKASSILSFCHNGISSCCVVV